VDKKQSGKLIDLTGDKMKDGFKGFYNPSDEVLKSIWNSDDTIFVFDTNVYLNIYSYFEKTKDDLFSVLDKIKNNLWVPNHVALEYQRRRLDVIDRERENFTKITNVFNKFNNQINVEIIQNLGIEKKLPALHKSLKEFLNDFNALCEKFVQGVFEDQKKLKPDVRSGDEIRKRLDAILFGKVGLPFTQDELNSIYEEGEVRFSNKIPPGFRDANKGGDLTDFTYMNINYKRKFGDLIIWKQLIKEASKEKIKNVIFITDDKKNDWWFEVGDKIIGPQEKLQSEFYMLTEVDNFKMYDTVDFLKDAVAYLGTKVDENSFDDVKKANTKITVHISGISSSGTVGSHNQTSNNIVETDGSNYGEDEKADNEKLYGRLLNLDALTTNAMRARQEAIRRARLGIEGYSEREEALRRAASLDLDSYSEREEALRRATISGLEGYSDREEALRRTAMLSYESLREREEAIRRVSESIREREEIMRQSELNIESLREQEEALKRTIWELRHNRKESGEMQKSISNDAVSLSKKGNKDFLKKYNGNENDQDSEDEID